jgi:hypothetical protein
MPLTSFVAPEAGSQGCIVGVFKVYSCYGTCESDSQILINCERCQVVGETGGLLGRALHVFNILSKFPRK